MGGRGASAGIPKSYPQGGGGGGNSGSLDQNPGVPNTTAEALGTKGRPMATRDAVMKANPFYDPTASTREYNENCQRSVVATEARFRGYDVIASPTFDGDIMPNGNNWANNFVGAKIEDVGRTTANAARTAVESKMKQYGSGSRAIMAFNWAGGSFGHVINVVQRGNKTQYYDGQNGTVIDEKSLFSSIKTRSVRIARVDNLDFSDTAKDAIRTTPKRKK